MTQPSFAEVIASKEMRDITFAVFERPIPYDEFLHFPMPDGISSETMWNYATMLLHSNAEIIPIKPWFKMEGRQECWFFLSREPTIEIMEIGGKAGPNSILNEVIQGNDAFVAELMPGVYTEVACLAQYDGIPLSAHDIKLLWQGNRQAASGEERVVANFAAAFSLLDRWAKYRPYSRLLIEDIQDILLRGIDRDSLDLKPRSHWSMNLCDLDTLRSLSYGEDALEFVARRAQRSETIGEVLTSGIIGKESLCDTRFVPALSNLTEYLLRCAYFKSRDMPILCYVPVSSIYDTKYHELRRIHERESLLTPQEGLSATWNYVANIKSYKDGVFQLEQVVERTQDKMKALRASINRLPRLSNRQKSFLLLALGDTTRAFSIKQYMGMYKVAYSTAHSDVMELVDLGYLSQQKTQNAHLFRGVPR